MLILTRRVGESVIIGDNVDVTVLGVKGNQVRIGVKAPKDVTVHREEIYQKLCDEQGHDPRHSDDHGSNGNGHSHGNGSSHGNGITYHAAGK